MAKKDKINLKPEKDTVVFLFAPSTLKNPSNPMTISIILLFKNYWLFDRSEICWFERIKPIKSIKY